MIDFEARGRGRNRSSLAPAGEARLLMGRCRAPGRAGTLPAFRGPTLCRPGVARADEGWRSRLVRGCRFCADFLVVKPRPRGDAEVQQPLSRPTPSRIACAGWICRPAKFASHQVADWGENEFRGNRFPDKELARRRRYYSWLKRAGPDGAGTAVRWRALGRSGRPNMSRGDQGRTTRRKGAASINTAGQATLEGAIDRETAGFRRSPNAPR